MSGFCCCPDRISRRCPSNACKFTPAGGKLTITTKLVLPDLAPSPPESDSGCDGNGAFGADEFEGKDGSENSSGPPLPHRLSASHLTQHNNTHSKPPPLEWIVVRIEVTDTGYGIRPKDMVQSKLFSASHISRFWQRGYSLCVTGAFNQTEQGRLQGTLLSAVSFFQLRSDVAFP